MIIDSCVWKFFWGGADLRRGTNGGEGGGLNNYDGATLGANIIGQFGLVGFFRSMYVYYFLIKF